MYDFQNQEKLYRHTRFYFGEISPGLRPQPNDRKVSGHSSIKDKTRRAHTCAFSLSQQQCWVVGLQVSCANDTNPLPPGVGRGFDMRLQVLKYDVFGDSPVGG